MSLDLSYALNPVSNPSELEEGDYLVAIADAVYMDEVSGKTLISGGADVRLRDGVLEPDHTRLSVSDDLPKEGTFRLNEVEELYLVPDDVAPEEAYEAEDLLNAVEKLSL